MNKMTEELIQKIDEAEYVLVGIGEEFNEKFEGIQQFPKLAQGLQGIEKDEQLEWAVPFLEKAYLNEERESQQIKAYQNLYQKIKDKNYFIVTTCIDENIEKAGFDVQKIVAPCGSYHMLQCSEKCNTELTDAAEYVEEVLTKIEKNSLQSMQQPRCPKCNKPLVFNNILAEKYAEEGYLPQWEVYTKWLQRTLNRKVCILELGVGMNLPSVIRWPFEKVAFFNQKASFFRINETLYQLTEELGDKGISIKGNAQEFLLKEFV